MKRTEPPEYVALVLERALRDDPGRIALVGPDRTLTYAELDEDANAAAALLADRGLGPGDRVAVCLPNATDVVVAFHAVMRRGAVWVGVGQQLAVPEKQAVLAASGARLLLCDWRTEEGLREASEIAAPPDTVVAGDPDDSDGWMAGVASFRGAGGAAVRTDPFAPAAIAFTSGTTGSPKGVVHSQHNLLLPGAVLVSSRRYGPDLRKGDNLAFTILNLLVLSTLLTSQAGGCCIVGDCRGAADIARWIRTQGVTTWNGVPTMLYDMVADTSVSADDLASLREVWTGGGRCPESLRQQFEDRFEVPVYSSYGLTEAPTVVTIEHPDEPHVAGGSGVALPHLEVSIRDGDRVMPPGEGGEVCVEGRSDGPWAGMYRPMLGYWGGLPVGDALQGGVLRTGDLGTLDERGNLTVLDRKKLLIVRGGANVYPAEVEQVLEEHPAVSACVVLGVPDDRLGERVAAVVEPVAGQTVSDQELGEYCRERLARYKVPDRFGFVDRLPRNAMGKVVRSGLDAALRDPPMP